MNIYLNMLRAAGLRTIYFDAPNEGKPGGTGDGTDGTKTGDETKTDDGTKPADGTKSADGTKVDDTKPADTTAKPDDATAALLREVMEKKNKLRDAENKLKDYEGVDPAEYRALKAEKAAAAQAAAEAKGDFERVKAMMAEQHKAEKDAVEAQLAAERAERAKDRQVIDGLTLGNAFANSEFITNELVLSAEKTRVVYGQHFEVKDGKIVAFNKPAGAADRTEMVDASGKPLAFEAALKAIVEADPDKKDIVRSKMKPGAGSKSDAPTNGDKGKNDAKDTTLRGRDRIAAGLAKLG